MIGAATLSAASAAAQETFPVWWSPEFGVDSRAEIRARLAAPLPANIRITLRRRFDRATHHYTRERDQEPVATCNDYLSLRRASYTARSFEDAPEAYALRRKCYPLWALLRAEPARTSHVRTFKMADDAFDYLPPVLAGYCKGFPALAEANREGVPWSHFFSGESRVERKTFARSEETFMEQIFIDGDLWSEKMFSIIGRGDFDGDGQDDLLVKKETVHVGLGIGTDLDSLFLLTRNAPDKVLRATESISPLGSVHRSCFVDPARLLPRR